MSTIDFILNLAGLLLWLKWRDNGKELSTSGISLLGTLRKAGPRPARHWFLLSLLALLVLRPLLYWVLGPALDWTPQISIGVIAFPFRSDLFGKIFLFSFFSFSVTLAIYYLSLIFLSLMRGKESATDPVQSIVRMQLGKIDTLPSAVKLLLPWIAVLSLWCLLHKPLVGLGMLPASKSFRELIEQGAVVGLGVYLAWGYLIVGILLLHLLNSYIYFGSWPFWNFIDNAARKLLSPLSWIPLRAGKIDFAPLVGMALVILAAGFANRGLVLFYQRLPL